MGATFLHYTCYHIMQEFYDTNYDRMIEWYPLLIEFAIDFKIESKRLCAAYYGNYQSFDLQLLFLSFV